MYVTGGELRFLYFEVFRGEFSEAHTVGASLNDELGDLILELLYEGVEFPVELLVCQFRLGRFEDTGFGDRLSGGVGAAGDSDEVGSILRYGVFPNSMKTRLLKVLKFLRYSRNRVIAKKPVNVVDILLTSRYNHGIGQ